MGISIYLKMGNSVYHTLGKTIYHYLGNSAYHVLGNSIYHLHESIEKQNEWLMHWEERWASRRIHGRKKRQVEEMFQEEKPYLKELPLTSFAYFKQETRTVWDDGNIQVDDSYYSALPAPLYQKVIVRIYEFEIEIIDPVKMEIIRRHVRSRRAGSVKMDEKDRIFNPSRQTEYLFSKARSIGSETMRLCKIIFQQEGRTGQRRMYGIVNLVRHFEPRHIEEAAISALNKGVLSYRTIRRFVQEISEQEQEEEVEDTLIQEHELIRSPKDYASFWEQHASGTALSCESPEESTPAGKEKRTASMERVAVDKANSYSNKILNN